MTVPGTHGVRDPLLEWVPKVFVSGSGAPARDRDAGSVR